MTAVELLREARAIVPPIGATMAIAIHDGTHHRAAFLVDGRVRSEPVGPGFARPRDAGRFIDILNGRAPASRPGSDDSAELGSSPSRDARAQTEAPASGIADVPPSLAADPVRPRSGSAVPFDRPASRD